MIHRLDSDLAVFGVQNMSEVVDDTIQGRKYMTLLFGSFALLAIILATVGLFGVVSWGVLQRRNEIAIRMTIGASTNHVLGMVVMKGLRPTIAGLVAGIPCALLGAQFLRSLLFQVRPADPFTFIAVSVLLLAVASTASLVPAARAARTDPLIGLRIE